MEVTFTFTRDDNLHYITFWSMRNRRAHLGRNLRLFGLLLAGYAVLFLLSNVPAAFAVGFGAFLAAVCIVWLHCFKRRRLRKVRDSWANVLKDRLRRSFRALS